MSSSEAASEPTSPTASHLELQYVKALFLRKEFRSCIAISEALLRQLSSLDGKHLYIHRAYIHFYLALAHDDMARQMYNQSKFKAPRFETAERYYLEARNALIAFQQPGNSSAFIDTPVRPRRSLPRERSSFALLDIPPTPSSVCSEDTKDLLAWQQESLQLPIATMQTRIDTQLGLVQQAKQRLNLAQAKRATARTTALAYSTPSPLHTGKKLQASKSFWSFTPEIIKVSEKDRRIEEGRKRGWTRERFQPARYRLLAEHALAEL